MKLECSCGGIAFATRGKVAYQGDATQCRSCGGAGHIAVTDDYPDDAVASWHLDSECSGGERCDSIAPKTPQAEVPGHRALGEEELDG